MQLVEEETRRYRPSKNYLEFLQPPKATFEVCTIIYTVHVDACIHHTVLLVILNAPINVLPQVPPPLPPQARVGDLTSMKSVINMSSNIAAKLCLILSFILFGNLMLNVHDSELHKILWSIQSLLDQFRLLPIDKVPNYICIAREATRNSYFLKPVEVFKLVIDLLQDARIDSTLAVLTFTCREAGQQSKVEILPIVSLKSIEQMKPAQICSLGANTVIKCPL